MSNNHSRHGGHVLKKGRQNEYGFEDQQEPYFLEQQSKVDQEDVRSYGKEKNKSKQNNHYKANAEHE